MTEYYLQMIDKYGLNTIIVKEIWVKTTSVIGAGDYITFRYESHWYQNNQYRDVVKRTQQSAQKAWKTWIDLGYRRVSSIENVKRLANEPVP